MASHSVAWISLDQAGLELYQDPPASASQVFGLLPHLAWDLFLVFIWIMFILKD